MGAFRQLSREIRTDEVRDRRLAVIVFLPVLLSYLASAHWTLNNADSVAAAWPAWSLVHHGTLHLEHVRQLPINPWFLHGAGGHLVSSRMPGVIFIGVPAQALFAWTGWYAMAPSVITAAVVTAAAVALMTLVLRRLTNAAVALVAGLVLAFGTTLWTVAGAELWTHGPDCLWLAAGLYALSRRRLLLGGLLFAPAVLTRPHLAVVIAAIGITMAAQRRSFRPILALGLPAAAGLVAVVAFNWYQFRALSIGAGSYTYANHALTAGGTSGLSNWATMTMAFGFTPMRGVLPYAPVVLLVAFAARPAWAELPDWGRGAAVGGVVYLVIQARINGIYSSYDFYGNRLTIESVLLWWPLVLLAARALWLRGRRVIVFALCCASIATELAGAVFGRVMTVLWTADPWRTWLPLEVSRGHGAAAILLWLAVLLLVVLAYVRLFRDTPRPQGVAAMPVAAPATGSLAPTTTAR